MSRITGGKLPGLLLFLVEQGLRASSPLLQISSGDFVELDVNGLSSTLRRQHHAVKEVVHG